MQNIAGVEVIAIAAPTIPLPDDTVPVEGNRLQPPASERLHSAEGLAASGAFCCLEPLCPANHSRRITSPQM
jgi:hypothetical protein